MALFKIKRGLAATLPKTYVEGYCYVTTDDGKFYIDTSNTASGRIVLNAAKADTANAWTTARKISISSIAGTTGTNVDGSSAVSLVVPSTMTGFSSITTNKLIIGATTSNPHIVFSRENYNYIVAPKNGSIAFSPGSDTKAGDISGTGAHLVVSYGAVIPGMNHNAIDLGSESYKWKNVYATTFIGKLSGNASSADTWKTARDFTIGAAKKSVNGDTNVSWTVAETGAISHWSLGKGYTFLWDSQGSDTNWKTIATY